MGDDESREGYVPTGGSCARVVGNVGLKMLAIRLDFGKGQCFNGSMGGHFPMVTKFGILVGSVASGSLP